jgi:intracellular sulfur oxidation DsrE/DsrF family protein
MIDRRYFMKLAALLSGAGAASVSVVSADTAKKQRVAYHVSEREKVASVLNNMRNHIKGMGGTENVELILVAHGPAMKEFHKLDGNASAMDKLTALMGQGVAFNACGNTMRALKYETTDIIDGAVRVDQGGVVRLAELQQDGYLYLRP